MTTTPEQLLGKLGNLWVYQYPGKDLLISRAKALIEIWQRNHAELEEYIKTISRINIPVYSTPEYEELIIKKSEETISDSKYYYPLDSKFAIIDFITNKINDPTVTLTNGIDFEIEDGQIIFFSDPNDIEDTYKETIFSSGIVSDVYIHLWAISPRLDKNYLANSFGYFLNDILSSTEQDKGMMNALLDSVVEAPSDTRLREFINSVFQVPIAENDNEIVQSIIEGASYNTIITDQNSYNVDKELTINVEAGDILKQGQILISDLNLIYCNRGVLSEDIEFITVPSAMLGITTEDNIGFMNEDVEVTTTGSPGSERTEWPLKASSADYTAFWDAVETRQSTYGYTFVEAYGETPITINPAKFLVSNILRNNGIILRCSNYLASNGTIAEDRWRYVLRQIIPPDKDMLIDVYQTATNPDLSAWRNYKTITISNTNVDEDIYNVPLLVKIENDSDIGSAEDYTGYSIRFTLEDGTILPFEKIFWENKNGIANAAYWVRVPVIFADSSTNIRCYYGCTSAIEGSQTTETWNNYKLVTHYNGAQDLNDYSGNGYHGVVTTGTIYSSNGIVQKAIELVDSTAISHPVPTNGIDELSILLWQKDISSTTATITGTDWSILIDNSTKLIRLIITTESGIVLLTSTADIGDGDWHFISVTAKEDSINLYIDGVLEDSNTGSGSLDLSGTSLGISHVALGSSLMFDELRLLYSSFSSAFIKFHYYNLTSGEISWS